ncbi:YbjN domain-containing protein [Limnofasciculus baicalensis]|uniref:YbjN domain-containing protein n=1 Tax=Limnofasciculus baicalensis BBK-W-15 TaxID=2699891 RepID=A0AAE3GVB2_9CYAN|nr:YbjN domain-containing protein [Limnofasciculus baicalensis]MCP2730626.1 YbjN domain-containing protein [Limnofasciculus baicalensis BBK-W-15]
MTSNQPIFDAIVNFFTQDNWSFTQIKKQSTLRLAFKGKNGKCDCYAQVREEQKQFIFYSVCPERVPKTKRRTLGEFLLRINYSQIIGSFDLDFSDGEIRYKTSISVNNKSLTSDTIKDLVYTNVGMHFGMKQLSKLKQIYQLEEIVL